LSRRIGRPIDADGLIVDAPPAKREVEFLLQVREQASGGRDAWRNLSDLSPVVRSLAHEQFDSLVKRVRVFAAPADAVEITACGDLHNLLLAAAD